MGKEGVSYKIGKGSKVGAEIHGQGSANKLEDLNRSNIGGSVRFDNDKGVHLSGGIDLGRRKSLLGLENATVKGEAKFPLAGGRAGISASNSFDKNKSMDINDTNLKLAYERKINNGPFSVGASYNRRGNDEYKARGFINYKY